MQRPHRQRTRIVGRVSNLSVRGGFVLLVVLAAIVVSGVTLASLATASLHRGLDALAAQEELQQRWGTIACEQLLLPRALELFEWQDELRKAGAGSAQAAGVIREQIVLGRQSFDLILADEGAKANLNAIYHTADERQVEQTLQRLAGPAARRVIRLNATVPSAAKLRRQTASRAGDDEDGEDEDGEDEEPLLPPAFRTWGDVFDVQRLRETTGDDRMLATLAANVTLWGTGRLNIDRAADDIVIAVCGAVVQDGLARRLLDRYRENPEADIKLVIEKEVKNAEDRSRLMELIGQGSQTYSLWTETASRRFRQQKFSVMQTDDQGQPKTFEFAL